MVDLDNAVDGFVALGMLGVTAGVTKHIIDKSMPRRRAPARRRSRKKVSARMRKRQRTYDWWYGGR
jgi:hypothetical protein